MNLTWRGWLLLLALFLPWLGVLLAGLWWLWQNEGLLLWAAAATLGIFLLWAGRHWWREQLIELPELEATNPHWSPREEQTWETLQLRIQMLDPADYPLNKYLPDKVLHLALDLSL